MEKIKDGLLNQDFVNVYLDFIELVMNVVYVKQDKHMIHGYNVVLHKNYLFVDQIRFSIWILKDVFVKKDSIWSIKNAMFVLLI